MFHKMTKISWLLFSAICVFVCDGYKILTVFPVPSTSHGILGDNMIKHLLDAGHEVTYITPYTKKDLHPNLRLIDVSANAKHLNENLMDIKLVMDGVVNFQDSDVLFHMLNAIAGDTLANPNVQKLMRDTTQKFDVVIGEYMFSDLYSVFGAVFQCPFIWFSTIEPHWMITYLMDGPLNPAYTSDYLNAKIPPYSFIQRAYELWTQAKALTRKTFSYYYIEEEIYLKSVAPIIKEQGRSVPSYEDLKYNASLLLGNTQVVVGDAISLPQSYKHIGGYHIEEEVKPLPENLKKIMDSAKNGVIYFSLGSNVKSKDLPVDLKEGLLKVFGGIKHTVIWKFEEKLANVSGNVHIVHWAPQQSILAHPNLKLFITHGGLLSVTESIHFGVPLITVPVFADQFSNANRAEKKGFAKQIPLTYKLHEDLQSALNEVLSNLAKYDAKAKELSVAYHDRLLTPKQELVYWVQHVVRTRGAPHLRSPALLLPLYQRVYLDLIAAVLLTYLILKLLIKYLLSKVSFKVNVKEKRN